MFAAKFVAQQPHRLAKLAVPAIVGQLALMLSSWLLPAVSEYRVVTDNISELYWDDMASFRPRQSWLPASVRFTGVRDPCAHRRIVGILRGCAPHCNLGYWRNVECCVSDRTDRPTRRCLVAGDHRHDSRRRVGDRFPIGRDRHVGSDSHIRAGASMALPHGVVGSTRIWRAIPFPRAGQRPAGRPQPAAAGHHRCGLVGSSGSENPLDRAACRSNCRELNRSETALCEDARKRARVASAEADTSATFRPGNQRLAQAWFRGGRRATGFSK